MTTITDFSATRLDGQDEALSTYAGKVVLVVNTASQCGFTPQFEGLEELYQRFGDEGFVILGFPCNQFGNQEPNDADGIGAFCQKNYGVSFPMFAKIDVNGDDAHPVFRWLRDKAGGMLGDKIKWNFTKFLIGRDGQVIERYGPIVKPEKIAPDIEKALRADAA